MNVVDLGRKDYAAALTIQNELLLLRQQQKIKDTLILVEHDPVITVGTSGSDSNILAKKEFLSSAGVEVFQTNRGGDVTYHGPGQIVGYPIIDLCGYGKDIRKYVVMVEQVFIEMLEKCYGVSARREEKKYTGVWVGDEKITAIGIAVKRWVSMHGFAFNVNTDLAHFKWINPCGITDKGVTSLQKLKNAQQDFEAAKKHTAEFFCDIFGSEPEYLDIKEICL